MDTEMKTFPKLGRLEQLMTDPASYCWHTDRGVLRLSTEHLFNPRLFQIECASQLQIVPDIPKREEWAEFLREIIPKVQIVHFPDECSQEGRVWDRLGEWAFNQPARTREGILRDRPWVDDAGVSWFTLHAFSHHLSIYKIEQVPLTSLFKERCTHYRKVKIGARQVHIWGVEQNQFPWKGTDGHWPSDPESPIPRDMGEGAI